MCINAVCSSRQRVAKHFKAGKRPGLACTVAALLMLNLMLLHGWFRSFSRPQTSSELQQLPEDLRRPCVPMAENDNGVTFALEDEDHTLANALRFFLNKNPHVSFCGYSIPHPAEALVNIRVQTTGEVTATEALRDACQSLKEVCLHVKQTFKDANVEFDSSKTQNMGT